MEQALGWLRWSPDQFWGSTLAELTAGVVGYVESRSGGKRRDDAAMYEGLHQMLLDAMEEEGQAV